MRPGGSLSLFRAISGVDRCKTYLFLVIRHACANLPHRHSFLSAWWALVAITTRQETQQCFLQMYVQLVTQLAMLSYAHPQLQRFGQLNEQTLEHLSLLSKVQKNPIFAPFNLEPGMAMIEKVKSQLNESGVHPDL